MGGRASSGLLLAGLLVVAGCGDGERQAEGPRPEPVVVYLSETQATYLPALFEAFTADTRVRVTVRAEDEQEVVARVIANRGAPPADVLLTPSTASIWRAAEEGALIPQRSATIDAAVPQSLRDPDKLWTAIGFESAVIVYDPGRLAAADVPGYESLAAPALDGLLCLGSSRTAHNRAVIATLIERLGRRDAERIVRGWIRNLAHPAYDTDDAVIAALADGTCAAGIVASGAVLAGLPGPLTVSVPGKAAVNVRAAGIARHARNPAGALALIEWLVQAPAQAELATASRAWPANPAVDVAERAGRPDAAGVASSIAGRNDEEARLLAERAGYR